MRYVVIWTTVITLYVDISTTMENNEIDSLNYNWPTPYYCENKDDNNTDIHCYGGLIEIPDNLNKSLRKLSITDSNIKYIKRTSLDPYRKTLIDIMLSNLPHLRVIEEGTFREISNLRTLYISHAPQLKFLHGLLRGVTSSTFYSLRIIWTGLLEVPDLFFLPKNNTMFLLDLDHNKIERLPPNSIRITAQQVTLNFNEITSVDDYAFNGSQISEMYIHSNTKLTTIGENAFKGLRSLRILDLSDTSIKGLPVEGLKELEILKITDTHTMQTIPSIYDLRNLKEARLTHSFHCCAFKYPEQHNPQRHAQYEENMKRMCKEIENSRRQFVTETSKHSIRSRELVHSFYSQPQDVLKENLTNQLGTNMLIIKKSSDSNKLVLAPLRGQTIQKYKESQIDFSKEDSGFFHPHPIKINETQHEMQAVCGNIIFRIPEVDCSPEPNALNPCEDIMGSSWLRISVWCVLTLALLGNLSVIIVVLFGDSEINVSRFLICNLAFADLCMGLYLLMIAAMDYHSVEEYFNFAYNWQYGLGCKIAGFLTVFSSLLSVFTLTVVTLERWFAITYAIYLTKRITLKSAVNILIGGWIYSILVAAMPILGVSNYSSTSICLPMDAEKLTDQAYLYTVIIINGLAFAFIVFCYIQIYMSLGYETRHTSAKGEMTIAKKMALLIFTDFATLAPVSFFGLTALAGYPLIGVTRSKILLVFFYPLNACANPYLYAIMTAQYRRDLYILVSRCGMCKKKAEQYRLSESFPISNPTPLLRKKNSSCNGTYKPTKNQEIKLESSYV